MLSLSLFASDSSHYTRDTPAPNDARHNVLGKSAFWDVLQLAQHLGFLPVKTPECLGDERDLLEIVVTESDCDELEQVSGKRVHPCFGAKLPELSPSR